MRNKSFSCLAAALAIMASVGNAGAFMLGLPKAVLTGRESHLVFTQPALPPAALIEFCQSYEADCVAPHNHFRRTRLPMTAAVWRTLNSINHAVNESIEPENLVETADTSHWVISPPSGNCHDYAATKRHRLIEMGIPAKHLLLAEVITSWNEHHLVLVVQTTKGDVILDNLNAQVRPLRSSAYRWVRAQTPESPLMWSRIANARQLTGAAGSQS